MTRTNRARVSSAVFLVIVSYGCGRKAPPRPPEDVLPRQITDLAATVVANGIALSWSRPQVYADGTRMTDLAGFVVERSAAGPRAPFQRIAVLEVTDRDRFRQVKRFRNVDRTALPGVTYRYRVVSFTLDRYFSAPSNVVTVERQATNKETHAPLPTPPG